MKKFFNIFLFSLIAITPLVFVTNTIAGQDYLKDSIAELENGVKAQDRGIIEKAIKVFEDLCKKNEKDHILHYWAAKGHYEMADYLDLKSPDGKDASGGGEKEVDIALEHLKQCLNAKDDYLDGYILKYLALSKKFGYVGFPRLMMYVGEINETLGKAMKIAPNDPWVNLIRGMNMASGFPPPDPKEPVAQFEKVLKLDPKMDQAYYQIALVYIKAKNFEEAKKNLQKALSLNPLNHWAKKKLLGLEEKKGEKKA